MFGRWLMLTRSGPALLRATSSGADPGAVEPVACDPPVQASWGLSFRDADANLRTREPGEGHAPLIYDP